MSNQSQQGVVQLDDDAVEQVNIKTARLNSRFLRDAHGRKSRHMVRHARQVRTECAQAQAKRHAKLIKKIASLYENRVARLANLLQQANQNPGNCRALLAKADQLAAKIDHEIILVEVPGKIGFQRELVKRTAANQSFYAQVA